MTVATILQKHQQHFNPVILFQWEKENVLVLDLTAANAALHTVNLSSTKAFTDYVFGAMAKAGAAVAVGGYNENRYIYRRSEHFQQKGEPRSIHVGIDIWAVAGTPIFAPLAGKVHSFQYNDQFGDYGPTIILEHRLEEIPFYTLYGHLSLASLEGLYTGKTIEQGEKFADIGNYPINGDWPPHLHFQVITDMQGLQGDFPGVCGLSEREKYLRLCPDPNLILGIRQLDY
ncbi:MAG: peptidoglycan DD-metalloendopeptidase family protein [Bacteroidota bacterium]